MEPTHPTWSSNQIHAKCSSTRLDGASLSHPDAQDALIHGTPVEVVVVHPHLYLIAAAVFWFPLPWLASSSSCSTRPSSSLGIFFIISTRGNGSDGARALVPSFRILSGPRQRDCCCLMRMSLKSYYSSSRSGISANVAIVLVWCLAHANVLRLGMSNGERGERGEVAASNGTHGLAWCQLMMYRDRNLTRCRDISCACSARENFVDLLEFCGPEGPRHCASLICQNLCGPELVGAIRTV